MEFLFSKKRFRKISYKTNKLKVSKYFLISLLSGFISLVLINYIIIITRTQLSFFIFIILWFLIKILITLLIIEDFV